MEYKQNVTHKDELKPLPPGTEGFSMPPEWASRDMTIMAWPVRSEAWLSGLGEARDGYVEVANGISGFEKVAMIVRPGVDKDGYDAVADARRRLSSAVEIWEMDHDDSWTRDSGPTVLLRPTDGERVGVDWIFNAWGRKYRPWDADDRVAGAILDSLGINGVRAPFVLEGGSIHVDGQGLLLTTEECLLNENRNPGLSKAQIEDLLKAWLGVRELIWLDRGIYGDETDGHVDNVACFASPGTVVIQTSEDPEDPNTERCAENLRRLSEVQGLTVVSLPQPPARSFGEERLALSYVNYYPVSGGLVVPIFSSSGGPDMGAADDRALGLLKDLYPGRKVLPVDGMRIIKGGGNVHCITQQIPAGGVR